jgi:two-component system, chemotaxis family, chemotaxis protein CheY
MKKLEELKVLVIDDSQHVHTMLKFILRKEGINAVYFSLNGFDGIKLAEEVQPDIIFLDNVMPKVGGLEVLAELRAKGYTTKIVMLSSVISENGVKKAKELGADYYIVKPFTPEKIKQVINKFFVMEELELQNN